MLLTITNTAPEATDIGFLLHKNPANLHTSELAGGKAYVFYSEATAARCTACLLVELDSVELVRGSLQLDDYALVGTTQGALSTANQSRYPTSAT